MKENKKVPEGLRKNEVTKIMAEAGFPLFSQGKVRDTYAIPGGNLLVVASDRISIFDFVLNALIPHKGEVLTALTHFWGETIFSGICNHLVESGMPDIEHANAALDYQCNNPKLKKLPIERCLVVKNMNGGLVPFEMIFRHHIGGSVYEEYQKTGKAGGQMIPSNLAKWAQLKRPLFTPSTKEEVGHDINVNADYFYSEMAKKEKSREAEWAMNALSRAYSKAYEFAKGKGVLILDTKFEFATKKPEGIIIVDEFLTPDSSRFVMEKDWQLAMTKKCDPAFMDKEPIREWGRGIKTPFVNNKGKQIIGLNNLLPEKDEHVAFVHSLEVSEKIINEAEKRYLKIFETLTGFELKKYQKKFLRS